MFTTVELTRCEDPRHTGPTACEDCATIWWTPRTAHLLNLICEALVDEYLDCSGLSWANAPGELHLEWIAADLPPALARNLTPARAAVLVNTLADIRAGLLSGKAPGRAQGLEAVCWDLLLTRAAERLDVYGVEDEHATETGALPLHIDPAAQRGLPHSPADYDFISLRRQVLGQAPTSPVAREQLADLTWAQLGFNAS